MSRVRRHMDGHALRSSSIWAVVQANVTSRARQHRSANRQGHVRSENIYAGPYVRIKAAASTIGMSSLSERSEEW